MLSKFSVRKPYTIVVAVVLILLLGSISFINLQTDLLPSIELPYLVVMTNYIGASPEEVEMVVTRPIEQVVATASNIKNINSISRENSSIVIMEFDNDVNMDSAIIEINSNLDMIKGMWSDSISSPMIIKMNPDMLPIGIFSVDMEDMDVVQVSNFVEQKITPELESISGVASVSAVGLIDEKIEVYLSSEKIEKLNDKVLDRVDRELSKAGDELDKAKREILDGKAKLAEEERKQREKLIEGEKAILAAKEKMAEGEQALNAGIDELNKNISLIEEGLKVPGLSEEERKMGETMALSLHEKLAELELQKSALIESKNELLSQEEQIAQGKAMLDGEMEKARTQLEQGEKTLEEKTREFEDAKEKAFKQASLDGIITEKMISGILAAQNFSMPAGYIYEEESDYIVKIGDKIKDIEEIGNLLLFDTGDEAVGKIYLKDVADIDYIDNSEDIYAKINGNNGVILTFQKQSNFATTEVSKNISSKMKDLENENAGLNFTALMDQGIYIDIVVDSVLENLIYGGILAILILIVFLRDIKPTFIIAVSIPISIVFAIAMMYFTGVTINIISLGGLALGVGMLVDNSIVVIENIYRLRNEGMNAIEASIEGAREVSGAIIASTLTTVSVFLPIVFTKGISKELFTDMGLTIFYSLLASLLVALTLVPTMASTMLKNPKEKEDKLFNRFIISYEKILRWSLDHRFIVMVLVVGLLALSGALAVNMGTAFIPEMDSPQMSLSMEMPKGSSFQEATEMADIIVDRISTIDNIDTIGAYQGNGMSMAGLGGGGGNNGNSVSMYLILDEDKKIDNRDIENQIMKLTEDLDVNVTVHSSDMDMSALGGSGIEVLVKGREIDHIRKYAEEIGQILENTEGVEEVNIGADVSLEEIRITVHKEKAMEEGLTVAQVFGELSSLLSTGKSATTLSLSNKDYPVIVVDGEKDEIGKGDIENLTIIANKNGEEKEIKIGDIADVREEKGLTSIRRKSQERYISVNGTIDKDYNIGLVSRDFERELRDYRLPDGYSLEVSGENKMIKDAMRDLVLMIALAIAFIYLIMVAEFQSLLSPFIVMFTIPLAFTGGFIALSITKYDISVISMLGFLVLSGVVVNNGIVFVDYTNQLREKGMELMEALVLTGKTRMRPILMTALTTILGLSTLSMGVGVGAEMIQPLAITAIGGLTYATILTLVVVPIMYSVFHKKKIRKHSLEEEN
ncbi:MAG: efflux RND transporter permease subunit [Tissierellaceae bacterium]|nr:efflux RND transporter permease subunit [Tissierellaceae bacterium]